MLHNNTHRPAARQGHASGAAQHNGVRNVPPTISPLAKPHAPANAAEEQLHGLVGTHAQSASSIGAGWAAPPPGASIFVQHEAPARPRNRLRLGWAGAGIYFFWQVGALKYLAERYDLSKVHMVGASAGSFISVLAACGVDAERVVESAYSLSLQHDIWSRPLGLVGIWGSLIEQWLDELLPHNAAELCRGRVEVIVSVAPGMQQRAISDFADKRDLIDVCMASAHVPLFLDKRLARRCRDMHCVDGSFPDFFTGENCSHLTRDGAVVFDYFDDPSLNRSGRLDMLSVKQYKEIKHIMTKGYLYAAKLHRAGRFHHFDAATMTQ